MQAKKEQPVKSALPLSHQDDGPRERNTPVPATTTSARPLQSEALVREKSPFMVAGPPEVPRAPSIVPYAGSPCPQPSVVSEFQAKAYTNGILCPDAPSSTASPRPSASRRTSSLADISPYLSKSVEIPSSAKRLRQLALLESVADESARLTPFFTSREAAPSYMNGMTHQHLAPPLPLASAPQAIGMGSSNIIYSSGPSALYQGNNIPQIPFRSPVRDPFQVRPRTSQAINRPVYHSPPSTSMSMNQSQLLALMNTSGPQPPLIQSRPPLPQFQPPPVNPGLTPSSPYHAPHIHPATYSPMTIPSTSFSAHPPPGIITSPQSQIQLASNISPVYGQTNNANSLLSILNQPR
ncbi:hypothetical protein L218DRAFT_20451 [Marasmius fiardii PR-910]|nr:hypothetical protein L218DRAFT_20451 [Marasmius fiardii PR-910]